MSASRLPARLDAAAVRLERLERLQALTAELSAAATPPEVARIIFDRGLSLVGARVVTLYWERGPGELELIHGLGVSEDFVQRFRFIGPEAPLPSAEVYRTGRPVWLGTPEAIRARFPEAARIAEAEGLRAWAALPLVLDRSRGALGLCFEAARPFDPEEREFVLALARQCAQALERARLFEAQQRLADRLGTLQAITSELSAALTPREVAAIVYRHLLGLGTKGGLVLSLDVAGGFTPVLALDADDLRDTLLAASAGPHLDVLGKGRPLWLERESAIAEAYPALEPLRSRRGDGAWGVLPLRWEGRDVGVLMIAFPPGRAPGDEDRNFAAVLAQQGAQALERARLFEAQRRLAERLGHLNVGAAALSGAVTPSEVAVATFGPLSTLGACSAELHEIAGDERLVLVARTGERGGGAPEAASAGPAAEVVRTGRALWLESREELLARFPELAGARGEAWAVVPLLAGGNALGALTVAFTAPRRFEADEKAFVRMLAMPSAQALERTRLASAAAQGRREAEWLVALLEGALSAAPVGLALLDRELRVIRASARLARLAGVPAESQRGRALSDLFPGLPVSALREAFARALESGERVDQELSGEAVGSPGETRRLSLTWYPVRVSSEIVGGGLLMREVTRT
jgi:GAF domain-containing protein